MSGRVSTLAAMHVESPTTLNDGSCFLFSFLCSSPSILGVGASGLASSWDSVQYPAQAMDKTRQNSDNSQHSSVPSAHKKPDNKFSGMAFVKF